MSRTLLKEPKRFLALTCLATALALSPAGERAWAQSNSIEALEVTPGAEGRLVVKVKLKNPPTNPPAGFAVQKPPRIALDFPDTGNALGRTFQAVGQGDLRSVNIVQAGSRTRLVMNLERPVGYDTRVEGREVVVTLLGVQTAGSPAGPTLSRFAETRLGDVRHSILDVDFRRGPAGEGRIIVDLSDTTTGIDLRRQGSQIIVDFNNTSLPKNLQRRLDVTDFGTPVQFVESFAVGGNARLVIEPRGLWEQSAYQADRKFIVEVKPVAQDPTRTTAATRPRYTGEKLSLNFQNVEVRAVLQVIADFTGLNIVVSDSVTGNLTLRLKDVPWDQALDIILQAKGLDKRREGNVLLVAPRDEIAAREKLQLEAQQQIAELEPTVTESFQLNYQRGEDVKKILSDPAQKILSKRGSAVVDPRTNTLFVQDTPSRLDEVRALIRQIDVPVRQVMIEARIVEANDDFSRNLGVRLGYHDRRSAGFGTGIGSSRGLIGARLEDTAFHTGQIATPVPTLSDFTNVNLPAAGIGAFNPGAFSLLLFNEAATKFLNLELSALEADNRGKIISSPRVMTADQVEATIEQGTEIPYQQATSSGATSVAFKKATLSLKVKPQITPDENVIMTLNVNKDSPGVNTTAGPAIDTKQISTQVLVENGGTVAIGGIFEQTKRNDVTKVPVLGDLPVVGGLFRNTARTDNRSELLIFITPRILKDSLTLR
ncbi:type IV pilus secretin PilQ [Pelomicrobium sp.]|jgi:type IV pilus assembly protein PilQ|uniref:type IV pilus secretin PilQ n=1 Tax=Pelomicrobium sp. TaxID=2815319 RepID=UPI002FDE3B7D